ncbi:MAG: hypothetical protein H6979_02875 [Chromatiales bacterium]|nr:hypothetical protein [Chromatiales bacterium]
MAKRKAFPRNPLVCDRPTDSLDYCAAVIDYVAHSASENLPSDSHEFGQFLVLMAVRDALRFEVERVGPRGSAGGGL